MARKARNRRSADVLASRARRVQRLPVAGGAGNDDKLAACPPCRLSAPFDSLALVQAFSVARGVSTFEYP